MVAIMAGYRAGAHPVAKTPGVLAVSARVYIYHAGIEVDQVLLLTAV